MNKNKVDLPIDSSLLGRTLKRKTKHYKESGCEENEDYEFLKNEALRNANRVFVKVVPIDGPVDYEKAVELKTERKLSEIKNLYAEARQIVLAHGKIADALKLLRKADSILATQKVQSRIEKLEAKFKELGGYESDSDSASYSVKDNSEDDPDYVVDNEADDPDYDYSNKKRKFYKKSSFQSKKAKIKKVEEDNSSPAYKTDEYVEEDNTEDDPDYEEGNEEDDSDYEEDNSDYGRKSKKMDVPKKSVSQSKKMPDIMSPLSSYEKMIEAKRAEQRAFLESFGINQVKADIVESVSNLKRTKQKIIQKPKKSLQPSRKSDRLATRDFGFSQKNLLFLPPPKKREKPNSMPRGFSFKYALKSEKYESFCKDFDFEDVIPEQEFISYDKTTLESMSLPNSNVCEIFPHASITSIAWYPSAQSLIVAAGSTTGNLGLWNLMDSESDPYNFQCHSARISNMLFDPTNPAHLITSSFDGTLRCCDLEKHVFEKVFVLSPETKTRCTYFDFLHPRTYLASLENGEVAIVDNRTQKSIKNNLLDCHLNIRTVHVHPVNKNVFVSAGNESIGLWDLRNFQKKPIAKFSPSKMGLNSAYFSPLTGNSIVTSSMNCVARIINSSNLILKPQCKGIKVQNLLRYKKEFFRAMWLPYSDDSFVVGSTRMDPGTIQIIDKNSWQYASYKLRIDNLTSKTFLNIFHPFTPALAVSIATKGSLLVVN